MKKFLAIRKNQLFISLVLIFIVSILLQWVQISNKNLYLGYDWIFHYNRFYDASQQIKEGNFQYFISMYGFSQSGRIINALYGPMFAYLNGLFLLICRSWFSYQLFSNFLITFLSAISMFWLLVKSKIRIPVSLIFSIMYSSFYVIQSWTFNQSFGNWGAFILPLIVLSATRFLQKIYQKKDLVFLAFAMVLAIQVHVLTALFSVIILVPFFIIGFIYSKNKKQLFFYTLIAALIAVFMTANVWYPLLEVNAENQLMRPAVVWEMENNAVRLDLVKPYKDFSLVVCLLFVGQFLIAVYSKMNILNCLTTIISFVFFAVSSKMFPWNDITNRFPGVSIIQFPGRLLLPGIVLIILALGLSIESIFTNSRIKLDTRLVIYPILLLMFLGAVEGHLNYSNEKLKDWQSTELFSSTKNVIFKTKNFRTLKYSFNSKNLAAPLRLIEKRNSDYLPIPNKELAYDKDFHPYGKQKRTIIENPINEKLTKKVKNHQLILSWQSNGKETLLPLIIYNRTNVIVNGKKLSRSQVKTNDIGGLLVHPQKGKNIVKITYKTSFVFDYMLFITILSWILLALWQIIRVLK